MQADAPIGAQPAPMVMATAGHVHITACPDPVHF
jgi:hypothetical protein